jgi:hypothetical protein
MGAIKTKQNRRHNSPEDKEVVDFADALILTDLMQRIP